MDFKLKIWRQKNAKAKGHFETYEVHDIEEDASFLEMLDILNEQLIREGIDPVAVDKGCKNSGPVSFDHDCREGICGACSLYIDGRAHGPDDEVTTCQLFMRKFKDGATITVEPWRSAGFPIIKDLVVDRGAYDKILQAGGYVSVRTGGVPDANAIPIPKKNADESMDAAACIGCGACHDACPWHMPTVNPKTGKSSKCIACGACVAGCPSGALSIVDWDAVTSAAQAAYMDL